MTSPIDKILEHEIDSINDHMPVKRSTLSELMESDSPHYVTRGGEVSFLKKEEIAKIAKEVPSRFHEEVKLPIVILRRMDYGPGIYTIAGEKMELFLIHRVLGQVDLEWKDFWNWRPVERLVRPQVQAVRLKFPSTTCIGFVTTVENG
ncbi:MAG: DUF61 family protein [Candidatus Thorarchaeota archaeon]